MNNYNYYDYLHRNSMNNQNLYNPKEGFEKGNMFSNLYSEYKNYKAKKLNPTNDQERRMYEIQAISFAAHDLNLYLDMYPEDQSMVVLFNDYRKKLENLINEYENTYGPMTIDSNEMENNKFAWVNSSWPWEVDNV